MNFFLFQNLNQYDRIPWDLIIVFGERFFQKNACWIMGLIFCQSKTNCEFYSKIGKKT